jgi:hypothetical protein
VFGLIGFGYPGGTAIGGWKERTVLRTRQNVSLLVVVYLIIGVIVAYQRHYVSIGLLKAVVSALLAIFLWFLVLLGVDLHVS